MKKLAFLILVLTSFFSLPAKAQQNFWIQMEVRPTLSEAQDLTRAYSSVFSNIAGFDMGDGWYAVSVGPYTLEEAQAERREYASENLIPQNSFIVDGSGYAQQFWPTGTQPTTEVQEVTVAENTTTAEPVVVAEPQIPEETERQARDSEASLTRAEKEYLQIALRDQGYYNSSIDGAFGRGTRAAMREWQRDNGHDDTGVLTTRQRAQLIQQYNAILEGLNMARVTSAEAGIEVSMPTGAVSFAAYEPPFVQYNATTSEGIRVLLISQQGTQATLAGLYDIMQTLEIVPLNGERNRRSNEFTLTGQNDRIHSYTYASLDEGEIKGFTLIWPAGDTQRMDRVIQDMRASFTRLDGVLNDSLGASGDNQRIDLLAGLQIRQPDMSRSGFFADARGHVVTTAEFNNSCEEITIDRMYQAEVIYTDAATGISVLRPMNTLAPMSHAAMRDGVARLQSDVAVAGYPYQGVLNAPTLTFGTLADIRGLGGEEHLQRLAINTQSGDAGGPIFDGNGAVIGMLLAAPSGGAQQLPTDVRFAVKSDTVSDILVAAGVSPSIASGGSPMAPVTLSGHAAQMTVLVSCWN